jgi:hypothetical protein
MLARALPVSLDRYASHHAYRRRVPALRWRPAERPHRSNSLVVREHDPALEERKPSSRDLRLDLRVRNDFSRPREVRAGGEALRAYPRSPAWVPPRATSYARRREGLVFGRDAEHPFWRRAGTAWKAMNGERAKLNLEPLEPITLHEARHTSFGLHR